MLFGMWKHLTKIVLTEDEEQKMKFHPFPDGSPAGSEHYSIVTRWAVIAHPTVSSEMNIAVLKP